MKTVLSFYCDDTSPHQAGPDAFRQFLDFVEAEGIAGESSVILGTGWQSHDILRQPTTDEGRAYVEQVRRAFGCGIDAHMELMTHGGLFDFETGRVPEGAVHEGLWLHEPDVTVEEYEAYFDSIIAAGERIGVKFTGVTWPGCGCAACAPRYSELAEMKAPRPNPNVWEALLNLAERGRFRGRTVPCFSFSSIDGETPVPAPVAQRGDCAVYDLVPNARDRFGTWTNETEKVDADYYISADGESGRIVELVNEGAPYCLFYAHWQGLNPGTGVGWKAFVDVVARVKEHLADRVTWMRPSEYTDVCFAEAGGG
jgi:hypothetical protein